MSSKIIVQAYDPEWSSKFLEIKNLLWPLVKDFAISVEHVGSTSVPGLAAKPIIDIDIIIPDISFLDLAVKKLAAVGYIHQGNYGIQDREAFKSENPIYANNLYVCPQNSVALLNHLCLRESLRADPKLRDQYGALKRDLAQRFPDSIDDYIEGKTDFILKILEGHTFSSENIDAIRKANLSPNSKAKK